MVLYHIGVGFTISYDLWRCRCTAALFLRKKRLKAPKLRDGYVFTDAGFFSAKRMKGCSYGEKNSGRLKCSGRHSENDFR